MTQEQKMINAIFGNHLGMKVYNEDGSVHEEEAKTPITMMLSYNNKIVKGNVIKVVEEYTDPETDDGYQVLLMDSADLEIVNENGEHFIPAEIEMDCVGAWKLKEEN